MTISTRPMKAADRSAWEDLFAGYAAFYKVDQTAKMRETVYGWLMDADHGSKCIVAQDDKGPSLASPTIARLSVSCARLTNCFLDDLFVSPQARGTGAAQSVDQAVEVVAQQNGCGYVVWIRGNDNIVGAGC